MNKISTYEKKQLKMKNQRIFLLIVHSLYYFLREPKFWLTATKSLIKRCGNRIKPIRDAASTHNIDKMGYRSKKRAIEEEADGISLKRTEQYEMQRSNENSRPLLFAKLRRNINVKQKPNEDAMSWVEYLEYLKNACQN